jgi:hypothetical protein
MGGYEVFMHLSLLESVPKSGQQRRRIMDFVRSLREKPDTPGDFTNKDASLRVRQVTIIGDYAITYWVDAPVKAVMVVDVSPADK